MAPRLGDVLNLHVPFWKRNLIFKLYLREPTQWHVHLAAIYCTPTTLSNASGIGVLCPQHAGFEYLRSLTVPRLVASRISMTRTLYVSRFPGRNTLLAAEAQPLVCPSARATNNGRKKDSGSMRTCTCFFFLVSLIIGSAYCHHPQTASGSLVSGRNACIFAQRSA